MAVLKKATQLHAITDLKVKGTEQCTGEGGNKIRINSLVERDHDIDRKIDG